MLELSKKLAAVDRLSEFLKAIREKPPRKLLRLFERKLAEFRLANSVPCGNKCGTLTCKKKAGHKGGHSDGSHSWWNGVGWDIYRA